MAINLSALSAVTTAASAISNLILVSPQKVVGYQPQNRLTANNSSLPLTQQPPAIVFNYEGEQIAAMKSTITNHYSETNIALQDQIAHDPVTITTHGFIGELNDIAPAFLKPVQDVANRLTNIAAYVPQVSTTAQIAYNEAFFAYQIATNAANAAVSTWSSISNSGSGQNVVGANGAITNANIQNKQQTYFSLFYNYWYNNILFSVQTPWAVFQNMAIQSLRAIQEAETNVITDFEVTFQQMRFASTAFDKNGLSMDGRTATQAAPQTDLGNTSGTPTTQTPTSLVTQINGG